jgi:cbb3-type cytochrome oxidase subunit 3
MEREVLRAISGIGIYPVVSLVMFFTFFVGVIVYVLRKDKNYINKMSNLPLDNNNE